MPMTDFEKQVKAALSRIEAGDRALAEELRSVRASHEAASADASAAFLESAPQDGQQLPPQLALETIVLRTGRPVLAVVQGAARLEFKDSASEVWRSRLQTAAGALHDATAAVGRIDLRGHPELQWVGTGWLVDDDTVLTNRHVAREFGRGTGEQFTFTSGIAGPIRASIDFLHEVDRRDQLTFQIVGILHIEDDDGPDMALLRVDRTGSAQPLASPIALAPAALSEGQQVAVIGYPARDSRIPDQKLMQSIFGDVYDRKRLAPGQITGIQPGMLLHDCSTLGGNSGSVVLDLTTGQAVGLHFAGRFLEANYAVPASVVAERIDDVRRRVRRPSGASSTAGSPVVPPTPSLVDAAATQVLQVSQSGVVWNIPLRIRIEVGPAAPAGASVAPIQIPPAEGDDAETFVEGVPSDYIGRLGYDAAFIGSAVPLPVVVDPADVLEFDVEGATEHVLKYQHFSVVMSRSRRLCFLSAVNIDGSLTRKKKRPAWRLDPRIPTAQQIRDECYGNTPKFSRGHMTRREDPVWGTDDEASLGNDDSMHVTNTVPQMQPFNAGIWLGLENYALEHARQDDMRISVFTGPFLLGDDPAQFGVRIPRSFWKVIAFIHDTTGELCATGYTMSQEAFLTGQEFVFAQHKTAQTSIRSIGQKAGLSFGDLVSVDPFIDVEEGVESSLSDFSQIRFIRR